MRDDGCIFLCAGHYEGFWLYNSIEFEASVQVEVAKAIFDKIKDQGSKQEVSKSAAGSASRRLEMVGILPR